MPTENENSPGSEGSTPGSPSDSASATPRLPDELARQFHDATGLAPSGGLPVIQWTAGELPRVVDEAEAVLIDYRTQDAAGARVDKLFQRGPFVVRVVRHTAMSVRAFKRPAGGLGIVNVDRPYLTEQLTRAARWEKYDSRAEEWRRINAPDAVALTYLSRAGHWKLPRLLGVISAPTLRPDGTLLQEPGYDVETATWYDPCGVEFPRVPDKPSKRQAQAALDKLVASVESMPFVEPTDHAVAVALMLAGLVRRSLPSAPIGAITAPTPESGKTLLADCIAIVATGVPPAAMQYPSSDEEAEKVALSLLMAGDPVVLIDNVDRPLAGAWLCSILTSETHQGRALGRNEMISVPTTTLWLATGNKIVIAGDLRTRAILCRIDPKQERPSEREFKVDLREHFMKMRPELVAAGLTLMRAYLVGGEKSSVFRPWGRFERWSQFCREPLMWLGLPDPCDSYALIAAEDPERQEHLQVMAAIEATFGTEAKTAAEFIAAVPHNTPLADALSELARDRAGALSAKRLAKWLGRRAGRIVEKRSIERDGETRDHVTLWRIKKHG